MAEIAGIDARWYAPLLRPVLSTVSPAIDQIQLEGDPWSLPRAGLGGAMILQISRGFGRRASRRVERVTVAAFEAYNHRLHIGDPGPEHRAQWLARDLEWAQRAWKSLLDHDGPTLTRVLDRLFGPQVRSCDRAMPEAVLFLRGAVAAGVVLGDVCEEVHDALDRHATWLGLSWEAQAGTLDAKIWEGSLAAIGLREPFPAEPELRAREQAVAALDALPQRSLVDLMQGALREAPRERAMRRTPQAWAPLPSPVLPREPAPTSSSSSHRPTLDLLSARWGEAIEASLGDLTQTESTSLDAATTYLRRQGGKRVRPLLTLAAAAACGGKPRRALPLAAAVEWLHQGTLVLDDIVDAAELRRGHATLHRATSDVFATGVAMFVFARVLRSTQGMHPEIRRAIATTAIALAEGERLELHHTGDRALSLTNYYRIIEAKTARLFGCAATLGALCTAAPSAHVRALARYGRELGLAFQIIDDLLDYAGREALLGKRPGTDLRAAKMTLPLLLLRDHLSQSDDRQRLLAALGEPSELGWIQARLEEHEVTAQCRARAATHSERAVAALTALPESEARVALTELACELGARRC